MKNLLIEALDNAFILLEKQVPQTKKKQNSILFHTLMNQFDDTTIYDMYMDKDFERLEKYYSLRFAEE